MRITFVLGIAALGAALAGGAAGQGELPRPIRHPRVLSGPITRSPVSQTQPLTSRRYSPTTPMRTAPLTPARPRQGANTWYNQQQATDYTDWDRQTSVGGIYQGNYQGGSAYWKNPYIGRP
ncbi:MAG: hypothetical protein PHN82_04605 [bacterium]|nr:hypothetical protein [bacterium]